MKFSIDKQDRYSAFTLNEKKTSIPSLPDLKSEIYFWAMKNQKNLLDNLGDVEWRGFIGAKRHLTANRLWKNLKFYPWQVQTIQRLKIDRNFKTRFNPYHHSHLTGIDDFVIFSEIEDELSEEE